MCVVKILVVDDESAMRDLIKYSLKRRKVNMENVYFAKSYEEAVNYIDKESPDIYLLDINLSGNNSGVDLIKYIEKTQNKYNFVSVVTATIDADLLIQLVNLNVDKLIPKGNDIEVISEYIETKYKLVEKYMEVERFKKMIYLQEVAEKSPISIVITDTDGNIQYANKQLELQTGYTLEELIGKNPKIFKSDYHDESFYKALWNDITAGGSFTSDICNKKKDGTLFWEELKIVPYYENNEIVNYIGYKTDITKYRETTIELYNVISAGNFLIFILDKDLTIIRHYPPESNDFIFHPSQFINKKITDLFESDLLESFLHNIELVKTYKNNRIMQYELGEETWEATISAFNTDKFMIVCKNVSDREDYISMKKAIKLINKNTHELKFAINEFKKVTS